MKKQNLRVAVALAMCLPAVAMADISLYGKANVAFELVDEGDGSRTDLTSNASRLGFKGSEKINDSLTAIYQLEYEVDVDDQDTFRQRNIFVGVKGEFGQVIGGYFDTPLKSAQNKVDLFNDLRGDIRTMITPNENRTSNTVMYSSPVLSGLAGHVAYISSENEEVDDGKSAALSFTHEGLYLGLAFDQDVEAENAEALRGVIQYNLRALQLGFLYEEYEPEEADSESAWVVSALYDLQNNWALKAQYAKSKIGFAYGVDADDNTLYTDENESLSAGVDYKVTNNFVVYGFYTAITGDSEAVSEEVIDNEYLGIGIDYKF